MGIAAAIALFAITTLGPAGRGPLHLLPVLMATTDQATTTETFAAGERTPRRRTMPAGRVLIVILVALLVWALLYAPELKRSAEVGPLGTRRTVVLSLLAPIVWVSDHTRLTDLTDAAARAAGRDPNAAIGGDVNAGVDPLPDPTGSPGKPPKEPVRDTKMREPTVDKQLRIAVVGDSLAQGIGFATEDVFKPYWTEVFKQGRISTGLARLDYFNWMAQMRTIVDRADPDLIVVMVGENDNQGLLYPDGTLEQDIGTYEWAGAYQGRVEQFAKLATSRGAHVVWVGCRTSGTRGAGISSSGRTASSRRLRTSCPTSATSTHGTPSRRPTAGTRRSIATMTG